MLTLILLSSLLFLYTGGRTFSIVITDTLPGSHRLRRRLQYIGDVALVMSVPVFMDFVMLAAGKEPMPPSTWVVAIVIIVGTYGFSITPKLAVLETALRLYATKRVIKRKRAPRWLKYAFQLVLGLQYAAGRRYVYIKGVHDKGVKERHYQSSAKERYEFALREMGKDAQHSGVVNNLGIDTHESVEWLWGGPPPIQFHLGQGTVATIVYTLPQRVFELCDKMGHQMNKSWHYFIFGCPLAVLFLFLALPQSLLIPVGPGIAFIAGLDIFHSKRRVPYEFSEDIWGIVEAKLHKRISITFHPVPIEDDTDKHNPYHWDLYSYIDIPGVIDPKDRLNPQWNLSELFDQPEHITSVATIFIRDGVMIVGHTPLTGGHCMIMQYIVMACRTSELDDVSPYQGFINNRHQYVNRHDAARIALGTDPKSIKVDDPEHPKHISKIKPVNGLIRPELNAIDRLYSEHLQS